MVHRYTWHCKLCGYSINAAHSHQITKHLETRHPKAKPKEKRNYTKTESIYGKTRRGQVTDRKGRATTFKKGNILRAK